ncbi:MAG: hypothetical protein ACREPB_00310 [Arenimonas sp.]
MRSFYRRLQKLEDQQIKQGPNRVILYSPADRASRQLWNAATSHLGALTGRVMLAPDFGSDAMWEKALLEQQKTLLQLPKAI